MILLSLILLVVVTLYSHLLFALPDDSLSIYLPGNKPYGCTSEIVPSSPQSPLTEEHIALTGHSLCIKEETSVKFCTCLYQNGVPERLSPEEYTSIKKWLIDDVHEKLFIRSWLEDYYNLQSLKYWTTKTIPNNCENLQNLSKQQINSCPSAKINLFEELKARVDQDPAFKKPSSSINLNTNAKRLITIETRNAYKKTYAETLEHVTSALNFYYENPSQIKAGDESHLLQTIENINANHLLRNMNIVIENSPAYKINPALSPMEKKQRLVENWLRYLEEAKLIAKDQEGKVSDHLTFDETTHSLDLFIDANATTIMENTCNKIQEQFVRICKNLISEHFSDPLIIKRYRDQWLNQQKKYDSNYFSSLQLIDRFYCEVANRSSGDTANSSELEKLFNKYSGAGKINLDNDETLFRNYYQLNNPRIQEHLQQAKNSSDALKRFEELTRQKVGEMTGQNLHVPGNSRTTPSGSSGSGNSSGQGQGQSSGSSSKSSSTSSSSNSNTKGEVPPSESAGKSILERDGNTEKSTSSNKANANSATNSNPTTPPSSAAAASSIPATSNNKQVAPSATTTIPATEKEQASHEPSRGEANNSISTPPNPSNITVPPPSSPPTSATSATSATMPATIPAATLPAPARQSSNSETLFDNDARRFIPPRDESSKNLESNSSLKIIALEELDAKEVRDFLAKCSDPKCLQAKKEELLKLLKESAGWRTGELFKIKGATYTINAKNELITIVTSEKENIKSATAPTTIENAPNKPRMHYKNLKKLLENANQESGSDTDAALLKKLKL
ncbi:MAG: hypothetical protein HQK50_02160 [Oligoflexia bacterium]|nr:hypothetical protein [Oligoflexia bacterium]